jgi:tRNA-dihydrouridine synthase B
VLLAHYDSMLSHYGTEPGLRLARKHVAWYSRGLPGSAEFRAAINRMTAVPEVIAQIRSFYAPLIARGVGRRTPSREEALAEAA